MVNWVTTYTKSVKSTSCTFYHTSVYLSGDSHSNNLLIDFISHGAVLVLCQIKTRFMRLWKVRGAGTSWSRWEWNHVCSSLITALRPDVRGAIEPRRCSTLRKPAAGPVLCACPSHLFSPVCLCFLFLTHTHPLSLSLSLLLQTHPAKIEDENHNAPQILRVSLSAAGKVRGFPPCVAAANAKYAVHRTVLQRSVLSTDPVVHLVVLISLNGRNR